MCLFNHAKQVPLIISFLNEQPMYVTNIVFPNVFIRKNCLHRLIADHASF